MSAAGSLYGTTAFGDGHGNVYKLTKATVGKWFETDLLGFGGGGNGWGPTGLILDKRGNFYGTTSAGGDTQGCQPPYGCGLVYELIP